MSSISACIFVILLTSYAYESLGVSFLPNLKDVAQGVAKSTKDAAQGAAKSTIDAAQGAAQSTKDAAQGAAKSTVGVAQGVAESTKDMAQGVAKSTSDAAQGAAESTAGVAQGIAETSKVVGAPVQQITVGVLSKACDPVKGLIKLTYDDLKGEREPDPEDLKITLKTSKGLKTHPISRAQRTVLSGGMFEPTKKTVLYVHGFIDDPTGSSFTTISKAFLTKGDYNILALDGSSLINWLYLRSTTYVRFMGERLGKMLAEIVKSGVPREQILLVGHSLGSHVAGFTGKMFKNITGQKLVRISSLDPAGPCFVKLDDDLRLSKDDAEFVDVIHSNAGVFGLKEDVGHVDFYPNGGSTQEGCVLPTCEHSRAWELYAESVVNPNLFPARTCKDWRTFVINKCKNSVTSLMGFSADPQVRGVYYLRTSGKLPFGLGKKGLEGPDESLSVVKELTQHGTSKIVDAVV